MTQYNYKEDYRRGGPAGGFPIHYNAFPQTNTTYCEAGDMRCVTCKATTFTFNDHNPSTYCVGANDCVCVKVCEADNWRNEALALLRNSFASQNESANATCPVAANTTQLIYGSSNGSSSEVSPTIANTVVLKDTYARQDPCTWYQNQTFCDVPRSCFECLNVPINSGEVSVYLYTLYTQNLDFTVCLLFVYFCTLEMHDQCARLLRVDRQVRPHARLPRAAGGERRALLPANQHDVLPRDRRHVRALPRHDLYGVAERQREPDAVLRGRERLRLRGVL